MRSPASSWCRNARAVRHWRLSVRSETPTRGAISSRVSPAKNRHSTSRPSSAIDLGQPLEGVVDGEQLFDQCRLAERELVERDVGGARASLLATLAADVVEQNLAHGTRREREEVHAIGAGPDPFAGQLEICLVHQGRRRHRVGPAEAAALTRREPLQLAVDQLIDGIE